MNDQEKRALAVQRELSELRAVADSFGELVGRAHRLNDELRASFDRLDRLRKEDELARKIDEADYQAKRGKYAFFNRLQDELARADCCSHTMTVDGVCYRCKARVGMQSG